MPHEIPFGRYELIQRLALGGMAELFLARVRGEGGFAKTCVVKRVLPHLVQDQRFVQMFLREGRLAATLNHPNLVQVFELGRVDEDYFLAMEYLAGEDLASVMERSREDGRSVPVEIALRIIREVCAGLHHAHERTREDGTRAALVHRDISPSNLFVTYHGQVKVLDFGIAKEDAAERYTRSGEVRGKPSYMAPEQLTHQPVDRRVDVWAAGVCLFELLSGDRLFRGRSTPETIVSVCRDPIRQISTVRSDVPAALDAVLLRALERDPDRRYPTAQALGDELEHVLMTLQARTSPAVLGAYLKDLFGEARAEEKVGRERGTRAPGPATGVISDEHAAVASPTTAVHADGAQSRWRPWLLATAALALIGAVVGTGWWAASEPPTPSSPERHASLAERGADDTPALQRARAEERDIAAGDTVPGPGPAGGEVSNAVVAAASGQADPADADGTRVQAQTAPSRLPRGSRGRPARTDTLGHLSLRANAPVVAWIGRKRLGSLPLEKQKLAPGEHRVRLVNEALGIERVIKVAVAAGRETDLSVRVGKGRLNIDADPWADVFLDGAAIGQTPMTREVWEGPHQIRLVGPGGEKTIKVIVKTDGVSVIRERLP